MAERIVTPGVYTREIDQSFLPAAIREIGAAIVGTTVKGPAFIPTIVSSYAEFERVFGGFTDESYVPFVVQDYLRNGAPNITVTRLLYEDGYDLDRGVIAITATSASTSVVTHLLHPTQPVNVAADLLKDSSLADDVSGSFALTITGSYEDNLNTDVPGFSGAFTLYPVTETPVSASIYSNDNNYLSKVYGRTPKSNDYPVYVQYENNFTIVSGSSNNLFENLGDVTVAAEVLTGYDFSEDYKTASTPWITSQLIGSTAVNLFKFHTISHGTAVNFETKIGIRNIRLSSEVADPNGYGTFTVEVRRVNTNNIPPQYKSVYNSNDTDLNPEVVESFQNVNLDPNSPRYIARVIGNQYQTIGSDGNVVINGDYENNSKYVRVEVTDSVENSALDPTYVPFGFRAMFSPIPNTTAGDNLAAVEYLTSQTVGGNYSSNNTHGFNFTVEPNLAYLSPVPATGATTGSNTDFYLGDVSQSLAAGFPSTTNAYTGSLQSALTGGTFTSNIATSTRNFAIAFQSGFDGARPNLPKFSGGNIKSTNVFGQDCSGTTSTGTVAYQKAFNLLSNTDYYDLNMLLTPGIIHNLHINVSNAARQLAEQREDTFYISDLVGLTDGISTVVSEANGIDSNYTATYYPWVKIADPRNGRPTWVPPSVVMPGVIAFNDANAAPWYAPAGLNRGGLTTVQKTYLNLSPSQKGELYEGRVNPIANFPNLGIAVWGQKTLQARPSALDRVNVRRLLIAVKKFIASSTQFLVFEQNTNATRNKFLNIVNPYLEQVKNEQGLTAFRVKMDAENNTPDLIDQNILYGQIFLQPTRTAEFIILDFNIQPTGASFPE
jgi:phage tail sheath protein FI